LADRVKDLLKKINLTAGVSYPFSNPAMARLYYRQACVALELGSANNPEMSYYPFHDYALLYMTLHCMGEFPLELLFTNGIRRLLEHDLASQANYIATLRTYLNNNMNITRTAEDLFLHRSTLLERLKRIEKLLQTDLEDPDQRLRLLITLKIMDANKNITRKPNGLAEYDYNNKDVAVRGKVLKLESVYQ
jgi:DNA-binding PucR family transcriptional regulator